MIEAAEKIIDHLEKYYDKKWSLLEINSLETKAISDIIEKYEGQNRKNVITWCIQIGHADHQRIYGCKFSDCPSKFCESLREALK